MIKLSSFHDGDQRLPEVFLRHAEVLEVFEEVLNKFATIMSTKFECDKV